MSSIGAGWQSSDDEVAEPTLVVKEVAKATSSNCRREAQTELDDAALPEIDVESMQFWAKPITDSMSSARALLGAQLRGLTLLCICAGLAGEVMAGWVAIQSQCTD
jgi:hypothetical protein